MPQLSWWQGSIAVAAVALAVVALAFPSAMAIALLEHGELALGIGLLAAVLAPTLFRFARTKEG